MCQLFLLLSRYPTFFLNFWSRYCPTPWLFPLLKSQGQMLSFQCSLYTLQRSFSSIHSLRKLHPYRFKSKLFKSINFKINRFQIKQIEWLYNIFIVILVLQIEVLGGILVNFRFYGNFSHFFVLRVFWSFSRFHYYFGHFLGFMVI